MTSLQMEISFVNVNVSYKRAASTLFSELSLSLLFLKNNRPRIIFIPRRHILGRQILPPF